MPTLVRTPDVIKEQKLNEAILIETMFNLGQLPLLQTPPKEQENG